MGRIKSAWEIALEKTESIEVDANKIRHNANIDAIRRKAGAYLLSEEDTEENTKSELMKYSQEDLKEALGQKIINSLSLPQTEMGESKKPQRLSFLLSIALPGNTEVANFLSDVLNHMAQYPKHRDQMMEQLKSQFEPMLRDKEERMRAQYGEAPHLTFENDKECREMANKYLERLQDQYQKTLDDAKEQLKEVFK
ncbi:MAG: hypothetical protein MSS69_11295 [Spirochaetales bacterium]|nr:hypothetical protein [Spirochaetales bacterium]